MEVEEGCLTAALWGGGPDSPCSLHGYHGDSPKLPIPMGMKVLESYLAFSDSTQVVGLGCIFRAWPEWNSRLPTWYLRVWVVVGPQFFSVVFGWSRAAYCLEVFSLARLLLWLERAAYVEAFLSALIDISRSLPSAMHKAKTNKPNQT